MKINEILSESIWGSITSGVNRVFGVVTNILNKIRFGERVEVNLADYMKSVETATNSRAIDVEKTGEPRFPTADELKAFQPKDKSKPNLQPQGTVKVDGDLPSIAESSADRDTFDLTAMIGYYNEYAVAWKLAFGLESNGVNIKTNVAAGLKQHALDYQKYIVDNIDKFKKSSPDKVMAELKRAEDGSEVMAKKMWDEIVEAHDLKLIDVEIYLTGKEAMGIGKEDIKVTIYKKDTEEVQDMIKASLKLYKTASGVNVYNATFASYLVTVLTGKTDAGTGEKAIKAFLKDSPQFADDIKRVTDITKQWSKIKTELKNKKDPNYRKTANEFITKNRGYQQMRDLLFRKMFDHFYAQDKAGINERILHRLGLDGADDIYLLIGTDIQKMKAVSSRTSEKFKAIYAKLKAGFNVRFQLPDDNPEVVACYLIIDSEDGEQLAKLTISFKEGGTFPHMWNMTNVVGE